MSDRKMFADMDMETQRFYSKIINTALFNMYAVDNHLFSALFCESDDPMIMQRWQEAEPLIMEAIRRRSETDPGDDRSTWTDF
ncbi:hypothetical protein ACFQPC_04585 [Herminiimonas glaciei]|uniref:Uncharacterized protein n=1 Tax=Herminiimonas glaciei TaxID=523788 RepID=A0ABW2I8D3_9BURK